MSTLKVNTLTVKCGSTITIGESGKTVQLATGASQTGFGRTGTVDWETSSIKTSTFTATNGEGYFCNTTAGSFTVNLPAGSAGAIVAVSDYARKFSTNNLIISPNGSEKIGGVDSNATLSTIGQSATFVYVDSTNGWINIQETSNSVTGQPPFITATGGTISNTPTCRIHTFTSPGTFCVSGVSSTPANNAVAYMVIAGGGGGGGGGCGGDAGGGGGAGGFREGRTAPITPYTASPLAVATGITVTAQGYPIVVGAGGAGGSGPGNGTTGSGSSGLCISSSGGGFGKGSTGAPHPAGDGGSGGGGRGGGGIPAAGGSGNTPPVSPSQGNNGGVGGSPAGPNAQSPDNAGGGGGGAGAVGDNAGPGDDGGDGGTGVDSSINNVSTGYAGGGGASGFPGGSANKGGGAGTNLPSTSTGTAGTANTGGGGGGGRNGGTGGSGIVIIRYKIA
tara:strand:- start:9260 stop:10603 length:1344 start_codon:yes stop_codon:yes gene_type:complete